MAKQSDKTEYNYQELSQEDRLNILRNEIRNVEHEHFRLSMRANPHEEEMLANNETMLKNLQAQLKRLEKE